MANLLADTLVSPTRYMRAHLQQRGWRLPSDTRVIPNVMPRRDPAPRVPSPDMGPVRSALHGCYLTCNPTNHAHATDSLPQLGMLLIHTLQ